MKCKVCGKNFKDIKNHLLKSACGQVDTNKPMVCQIEYKQTESNEITIPMKLTLTINIEKIEALQAKSAKGEFKRTDTTTNLT